MSGHSTPHPLGQPRSATLSEAWVMFPLWALHLSEMREAVAYAVRTADPRLAADESVFELVGDEWTCRPGHFAAANESRGVRCVMSEGLVCLDEPASPPGRFRYLSNTLRDYLVPHALHTPTEPGYVRMHQPMVILVEPLCHRQTFTAREGLAPLDETLLAEQLESGDSGRLRQALAAVRVRSLTPTARAALMGEVAWGLDGACRAFACAIAAQPATLAGELPSDARALIGLWGRSLFKDDPEQTPERQARALDRLVAAVIEREQPDTARGLIEMDPRITAAALERAAAQMTVTGRRGAAQQTIAIARTLEARRALGYSLRGGAGGAARCNAIAHALVHSSPCFAPIPGRARLSGHRTTPSPRPDIEQRPETHKSTRPCP